jgi:nicotinate phosphoribosyltransferase
VARLIADGAPIAGFGVGTALDTSGDAPSLDAVYKLQSYAGVARRKRSEGKATWPGIKQVWRRYDQDGRLAGDTVELVDAPPSGDIRGEALLQPCLRAGRRLPGVSTLAQARAHCASQLDRLPDALRALDPVAVPYPVDICAGIRALARQIDAARSAG